VSVLCGVEIYMNTGVGDQQRFSSRESYRKFAIKSDSELGFGPLALHNTRLAGHADVVRVGDHLLCVNSRNDGQKRKGWEQQMQPAKARQHEYLVFGHQGTRSLGLAPPKQCGLSLSRARMCGDRSNNSWAQRAFGQGVRNSLPGVTW
jgi:hypothetical protein